MPADKPAPRLGPNHPPEPQDPPWAKNHKRGCAIGRPEVGRCNCKPGPERKDGETRCGKPCWNGKIPCTKPPGHDGICIPWHDAPCNAAFRENPRDGFCICNLAPAPLLEQAPGSPGKGKHEKGPRCSLPGGCSSGCKQTPPPVPVPRETLERVVEAGDDCTHYMAVMLYEAYPRDRLESGALKERTRAYGALVAALAELRGLMEGEGR